MKQMPRRRQGHLNNGGGLESGQTMGEDKNNRNSSGAASSGDGSNSGETYNYLHKKFKKVEPIPTVESPSKSGNPSLEALFQVTGHELLKIQSSNGVDTPVIEEDKKKGHVCPFCGLFWGKPSVLQKHIRAHTNERPYPCLTCGFAFKTKSNLYKHCKTRAHHQKANSEGSDDPPVMVEAMDTDESEVEESIEEQNVPPTTPPAQSGVIYKPKFHSIVLSEAGTNSDQGDNSPKLATPEFLQQHITKLISQNAAIVDTFDSSWPQRYKRQASVPANVHLADQLDFISAPPKERLRHLSEDSSSLVISENELTDHNAQKSKNPQNPEGSIIKDLLLNTRLVMPSGSCIRLSGGSVQLSSSSSSSATSVTSQQPSQGQEKGEKACERSLYSCHRCNINFKSVENLEAHKRHYCPRLPNSLLSDVETDLTTSQAHKPRGRPKGSKNRPKKEDARVHSKSMSEGSAEEVSSVTSRRNSIALGEGTESIKDILTSVKWTDDTEMRNPDGPILKKHLLQGGTKVDKNSLPIKKQRFQMTSDESLWGRSQKDFDSITKPPMRTNNSVHLYGGEVEILDEGSGATKRIVIDSQFYNGQTENPKLSTDIASSVVATIAKPVHNSGGTVLQVQDTSIQSLKAPVCIPLPQVSPTAVQKTTVATVVISKNEVVTTVATLTTSVATRPTTLMLNSSHSSMMGTTLVSPETPRPNRKYGQCYFNGQYYTYLELKQSTRVYYCCIFRPQPMYIPQTTDPKLSMYSVWQTVPPSPDPFGLNPSRAMALYNSHSRTGSIYSVAPRVPADLTLTHSTYWTFQQQKKEREKLNGKKAEEAELLLKAAPPTTTAGVKLTEEYTYVRGRGRGKYICHECGIRCKKPSMLKKHVRTHTDVRPYTCKHCNFSFKTKGNLTKHMKSKAHHKKCVELGIVPVPITIDDAQIDEEAVERQERIEHQRKQFANDEDSEIDEEEEEEEEEEFDEEDGLSHQRFKEGEDEEEDDDVDEEDEITVETGQFDDAPEPQMMIRKAHSDQEMVVQSLLDLGLQQPLNRSSVEPLPTLCQEPCEKLISSTRVSVSSSNKSFCRPTAPNGECDQPIDLSMPHQRTHEEGNETVEEEEEEAEQWSEEDSEDIVVDDEQPSRVVQATEGKKVDLASSLWSAGNPSRQLFESGGSSSCHPTPGVTQIYPSGPPVLSRPQMINSYMHRSMEDGKCVCTICNKSFSKPSQLRLHFNIHYFERPFRCDSCAISFRTKGHLQKHRRSVSHYNKVNMNMTFGTPTTDNPRPFKCPDCKIAFRIHGHLAKHLRSKMHIMKLECLGKLPFGTYAEIERSGANLNEIDTTDCENSLESLQVMAHRLVDKTSPANNIPWTRERTISGGSCDDHSDGLPYVAKSGSEEDLSRPQQASGLKVTTGAHDYEDISEDEDQVAFRCHLCGKRVKSAKFLQVHMFVVHSDNNNEASSTSASVKSDLEGDRSLMVDGGTKAESEVSCELCGELCSSQQDLSQHLLSHARCRPYICHLCDSAFTSIHYLKLHVVTHQQGIVFGCEECGGSFGSVGELELHMDRRHSSSEGVR